MRLIDADALYDAFERSPWMDNADRDIAEEVMDNAPTVNPQPDPDTGLMPCGCGGKAGFHYSVMMRDNDCYVECGVCGEHSKVALSEDKARDVWNYSMGYRGK
ncbi:MAG: hypothetical protein PHX74_10950 [Candidatus Sumerlaeales bacterium]|nr:hypothetical protein [Candidatus Sumerlaeales bacterium]